MVIKRREIMDVTPDPCETKKKTKSKKRKKLTKEKQEEEEDDGTPLRGIFCLKKKQDMKVFEEKEDCFILEFDPNDSFDPKKLSDGREGSDKENEVTVIHEKGQVACRDFPHPRHHCSKFPFRSTLHATHCKQCYCYVCDLAAPCERWISHCEATEHQSWKPLREFHRNLRATSNK